MFRIIPAIALALLASTGLAAVTVIEGFEDTDDPGSWGVNLTPNHTVNATVGDDVPEYVSTFVTEGSLAGRFTATWTDTPTTPALNLYQSGGPELFWAVRYNISGPSSLPNNSIPTDTGILQADMQNNSAYPVQVALVVDSQSNSQLERGPLVQIDAGSTVTYTWNFASQPPVGFDTGDGAFTGDQQRVKSLLVYSPAQPTAPTLDLIVDNIRNENSPETPVQESPKLLSIRQGSNPGEAVLNFTANPGPQTAAYGIFVATDANFGNPVINRLTYPDAPATTVTTSARTAVLTGLPTGQPLYVAVNPLYTPNNQAGTNPIYTGAIRLAGDGSDSLDHIVFDANQFTPEDQEFVSSSYSHGVVYTAQALDGLNRTFDFTASEAIDSGAVTLVPNSSGVVVWSNLRDGEIPGTSLSVDSQAAIIDFLAGHGNIIVSGSAVAQDLAASPALLEAVLKASLASGNINVPTVVPSAALSLTAFSTNLNPMTNSVAYGTSENDGLLALSGTSTAIAGYSGIPAASAAAGISYQASLIFLGFSFETAGSANGAAASSTVRQNLMDSMINYLIGETAAQDWQLYR